MVRRVVYTSLSQTVATKKTQECHKNFVFWWKAFPICSKIIVFVASVCELYCTCWNWCYFV